MSPILPDVESLRCFDAAATRLNFRAASAQVFLSPAAFSDRIKRLEEQVGQPLFVRTTRHVALTAAGQALWPRARVALEAARACLNPQAPEESPYELVLSTRFELGLSWLVPALAQLETHRPQRTVHLHFADSAEMMTALRRGTVDCAVSSVRLVEANLKYTLLHEESYVFVAAPRLVKAAKLRTPDDASGHRLLDISGDLPLFRYFLDARPRDEKWTFQRVQHLGTIAAVRALALAGRGVAVLPRYFVREDLAKDRLTQLFKSQALLTDYFRLIWRAEHPRHVQLEQLGAVLQQLPIQ